MNEELNHNPLEVFHYCSQILEGRYGPLVQTVGVILFVLIFNFAIKAFLYKLGQRFANQQKIWALSFVSALHKPLFYFVWFAAALCTLDIILSSVFQLRLPYMHLLLSVGAVLAFGWFLMRWNHKVVHHMLELSKSHKIALSPGKLDIMSKVATISVIFITLFLLMDVTGRSMQTLIAFGGIGGLALAFASQQVISNFFGGLMIYITQPFTIGEWVNLPDKKVEGHIEEIGWYLTRIRNFEKRPIYVPNSIFTQTIVLTPSRMTHERFHYTIGIRYQDLSLIKKVVDKIKLMLAQHAAVDHRINTDVFFNSFGSTALTIEISAYIALGSGKPINSIKQDLLLKVAEAVEQEGAQIATPGTSINIPEGIMLKGLPKQELGFA